MGRVITSPGVLKNVQGQIDHVTDMYDDIKDNNLKPLTITLDPVTNANGAYSHTTEDERITEDMKPVTLEVGTPECFYAPVTISTANGSATVQCADAHGSSTITVTFVKTSPVTGGADYPPAVTSTEFDILADRIGALTDLDTTYKSSIVNAVNEVIEDIGEVNSNIAKVLATSGTVNVRNLSSYTAKTLIEECTNAGYKLYYCSCTGGQKLSDLPIIQAGIYVVYCDTVYRQLHFYGTNGSQYEYDYTANAWTSLSSKTSITPTPVSGATIENISTIIKAANIVCANISIKFAAGTSLNYLGEIASGFPVPYSPIYVHATILETGTSFNMRIQSTGKLVSSQEMSFTSQATVMVSFAYVSA